MSRVTTITDALAVACPQCRAEAGQRCTNYKGSGCAPHRQRTHLSAATPPPASATDFDADTPPPRGRPVGAAVPRFVRLPAGEQVLGTYRDWDAKGRIPAGSILCDHVGTAAGHVGHSGYRVAGLPDWVGDDAALALGTAGELVPAALIERFAVAVVIQQGFKTAAVFAPLGGPGS